MYIQFLQTSCHFEFQNNVGSSFLKIVFFQPYLTLKFSFHKNIKRSIIFLMKLTRNMLFGKVTLNKAQITTSTVSSTHNKYSEIRIAKMRKSWLTNSSTLKNIFDKIFFKFRLAFSQNHK